MKPGSVLGSKNFTDEQRSQALTICLATSSVTEAMAWITRMWSVDLPDGEDPVLPGMSTLYAWKHDTSITPDANLMTRIEVIRRGKRSANLEKIWDQILEDIENGRGTMTFKDWRDVMIAIGISVDKTRPPDKGGINFNINDMRQQSTYVAVTQREDPALLEGEVKEVIDDDIEPASGGQVYLPVSPETVGTPDGIGEVASE